MRPWELRSHYFPGYWNPQALLGFTITGIYFDFQSILYSFTVGGIAAGKYEFMFSRHLKKLRDARQKISHDRKVILGAVITFTLIPAILFEQFVWATLFGLSAGTLTTLYLRKDLIRESLFGGITFLALHFGILILLDPVIYPGWISEVWTVEGILGVTILTVPLGEVLFAFLFGTLWAPFYETIEGYRIAEQDRAK